MVCQWHLKLHALPWLISVDETTFALRETDFVPGKPVESTVSKLWEIEAEVWNVSFFGGIDDFQVAGIAYGMDLTSGLGREEDESSMLPQENVGIGDHSKGTDHDLSAWD